MVLLRRLLREAQHVQLLRRLRLPLQPLRQDRVAVAVGGVVARG